MVVLLALFSTAAMGQSGSSNGNQAASSTIMVNTRIVYVDVVVRDSTGQPVQGLTEQNFKVLEDGRPQHIDYFAASTHLAKPKAHLEFSNAPAPGEADSVNLVLFDLLNTAETDQLYARQQMLQFLKDLPPGQKVALFVLSDRLYMVQGLTGNSDVLLAAAKLIDPEQMALIASGRTQRRAADSIANMANAVGRDPGAEAAHLAAAISQERALAATERQQLTIEALLELVRATGGYRGRKNLIWLAGGFPVEIAAESNFGGRNRGANMPSDYLFAARSRAALDELANAQIAVYPIDVLGTQVGGVGVDTRGSAEIGPGNGGMNATLDRQFLNRQVLRSTMNDLASQTGGKAFYGSNDFAGALRQSIEDGSHYYTLAYQPTDGKWNGQFRKIRVEVQPKGYELSYRRGYFATAPRVDERTPMQQLDAALQPGVPQSSLLLLQGKIELPNANQPVALVYSTVDVRNIGFTTDARGVRHAQLAVMLVALERDPAKQVAAPPQAAAGLNLDLTPEQYTSVLKTGVTFRQGLALKPGRYVVRLGVSDIANRKVGTLDMPLDIPAVAASGRSLRGKLDSDKH